MQKSKTLHIYLTRHGQDQDNAHGILNGHRDTPLTELGIRQAQQLADKIKLTQIKYDHVYTSPLQRASQTAQIITDTLQLPSPQILPELIEREFGIMTGKPIADIPKLCSPHILITHTTPSVTYMLKPQGAETFPQLVQRARQLLTFLKKNHPKGNLLLVTHGDFGKMIYAAYYRLPWKDVLQQFHF